MSIKLRDGRGLGFKTKLVTIATTVALSGVTAIVPFAAVADHNTTHTIEQLQAQIVALQAQLVTLLGGSTPAAAPAGACSFTRSLTVGSSGDDVMCLQKYLNGGGYKVAASGAGSPGSETKYFGNLTKAAVASWQAAMGVSPAAGYFGPISRAKYDSVVAAAPAPAPTPTPTTPGAPTPAGTGLTVSSPAEQPASALIPEASARVPFVKLILTASADGDAAVKSITVERKGLADDAAFDGILLVDEDGTQIGTSKTLSADHKVTLTDGLTIKAGTSKTVKIAANMATSLDNYNGQIARLAVLSVDAGTTVVNGAFPIESNGMNLNSTLAIGSVTMSVGSLDPGSANSKNVGTKGYYLASVKASAGSAENVTFEQIRFDQAGSAASGDLENVVVKSGDKEYPTTISGKYYVVKFPEGLKIAKGANVEFSIKADLINGSARTVDMNILRKADLVVKGDTYGHYITVGGGSAGAASAGAFSTNQEPFFNAYAATIDKGSILVSSSSDVPSANVAVDVSDVTIGGFLLDVKGEPIQISSFKLNFVFTGTGTSSDITGVKLYNKAGSIVAGPKDPASGVVTFTDTWTAPVGENHFTVKAKLDTSFVSNDTVQVSVDPDDNITAKGEVTGLSVTPSPTSRVTANNQTVKAGALAISVSPTPFGQNVVRGINGYTFARFIFDAGSSGEDVRVTSFKIRDTISANGVADEINNCVFFDGATALNTGSDVLSPTDDATGTTEDNTVSLTNNLIVPKGTTKSIDLKCNITSSATNNSTHSIGVNDTTAHNVVGALTSQAITESVTANAGSQMIIKTTGSFTVVKDASSPVPAVILGGKTGVSMVSWKYHATDEAVKIKDATFTFSTSTASTSDFVKATVWDGATKVGEAVWAGTSQFATSTLTSDFIVPKDGDKVLTVSLDLPTIGVTSSSTAGRLLAVHYDGNSSTTGVGMSSGQNLGSGSSGSFAGDTMQIMKTVPKLEKIAVPASSITVGDAILYRFKVTADAAGPVALNKFTFNVSSSSVSATTSNFRVFGYSDSGFSVNAYAINPLNFANVDCVGASTYEDDGTAGCNNVNPGSGFASSTEVVYFFGPAANAASSSEAIIVNAGETRYFQLRGDISNPGAGTGNSFQVSLLGDAARTVRKTGVNTEQWGPANFGISGDGGVGTSNLANALEVARQSANNDFVWSPMSTTTTLTGATSTTDWANGFLVPGLPSTNMDANTFSN